MRLLLHSGADFRPYSVKLGRGETAREVPAEVLGVHTDATGKKTVAVVAEDAVVLVGIGALVFDN